jgi:hypothetical protein
MGLRDQILTKGYAVLPGVFTKEEVLAFQCASKSYDYGDLLSYPKLAPFVLNESLLSAIREVTGSRPVYFGDSGALVGPRPRGMHRDLKGEEALTLEGFILRAGLYISPQGRESGGLKIVPHTQHQKNPYFKNFFLSKNIVMETGDVIIWDLRLFHSGSALMPFGLNLSLHPLLENLLDRYGPMLNTERLVLLSTFSDKSELMNLYCRERDSEHMREHWLKSFNWTEDVINLVKARDIEIVRKN